MENNNVQCFFIISILSFGFIIPHRKFNSISADFLVYLKKEYATFILSLSLKV